jgi:uncharacterized membrane protein
MIFCNNCGAQVQEGVVICPSCGEPVMANAEQNQQQFSQADPVSDAQANKLMAILAYIIFFIPLLTGDHKKSPFVRYHANQGIVLFISAIAWGIVYGILSTILAALLFNPYAWGTGLGVYGIVMLILGLLWIVPSALCILGIVHAATGKMKPLPVIGRIKILK